MAADTIRIPPVTDPSDPEDVDAAIAAVGEQGTVVDLLRAVDGLSFSKSIVLATVVAKLEKRKQDVEELLSISKSASELEKKINRLARRLLVEETSNGS